MAFNFINRFAETFRKAPRGDERPISMRVRHGLIAALAGDWQVILNCELALARRLDLQSGAIVQRNYFAA